MLKQALPNVRNDLAGIKIEVVMRNIIRISFESDGLLFVNLDFRFYLIER